MFFVWYGQCWTRLVYWDQSSGRRAGRWWMGDRRRWRSGRQGAGRTARGMMSVTRSEVMAAPALSAPVTGTARCPVIREEASVRWLQLILHLIDFDLPFPEWGDLLRLKFFTFNWWHSFLHIARATSRPRQGNGVPPSYAKGPHEVKSVVHALDMSVTIHSRKSHYFRTLSLSNSICLLRGH